VDVSSQLDSAVKEIKGIEGVGQVEGIKCDVSQISQVEELREKVLDLFGEVGIFSAVLRVLVADQQVDVLLNNAGISEQCPAFSLNTSLTDLQANWHKVLDTNFFGILNVAQAFAPHMARQENASVIINTGSKQGITCPP
jgi:NAD(P)-dependent dehydrogenase (short-subunit alcohol dehydrogenase family)